MKLLCLHGAYGSAKNFQVQLAPFISVIEKPGAVDMKWVDGGHKTNPPTGFEDYFGVPPLYRFINFDGISGMDDMTDRIRDIPEGSSAEETMRLLVGDQDAYAAPAVKATLERLFQIVDEDPEIDGILGYSEGATVAATFILEERRRFEAEGRPRRIKSGIFFAGWPPVQIEGDSVKTLLADECKDFIDIPTCHIVGANDPYVHGAVALYSMCEEDSAMLFDHGKGHTVPRDARTISELSSAIESTLNKVQAAA